MIIETVIITSFGGLSGKQIGLQEGMNVIVGPNESGKSTIYHAIENTLFTPSNLTPAKSKKQIGRFIPVGGGDTVETAVRFKSRGNRYTLQRRWGASCSSSLVLPDGSILTDDNAIQGVLRECMQAPEGTYRKVMMTYQTGLARTIRDLQHDKATLESLGDLLRKAVMEMDGVSVDAFRDKIEDACNGYFARWDMDAGYPEGNRGIESPWLKGTGSVTQFFYEKENLRKARADAAEYEEKLDEVNRRITDYSSQKNAVELYIKQNKPLKEDAVKRRQIEAEAAGLRLEYEKLEKINTHWPVVESKIYDISKQIPELEEREKRLAKDKEEAERYQKDKLLLEHYSRVKTKKQAVEEADRRLQKVTKLSDECLKVIREAVVRKSRIEAALSGAALAVRFTPRQDMEVGIQKGLEDMFRRSARAGTEVDFQAEGRFLLSHQEWDLEVRAGELDYEKIVERYKKAQSEAAELLRNVNAANLAEAEAMNVNYKAAWAELEKVTYSLQEELGEDSYESLEEKIAVLQVKKPDRGLESILSDLADTRAKISSLKGSLSELQEKHRAYVEEFGDHHQLLEGLTEISGLRKQKEKILGELRPLPPEMESIDAFIHSFEEMESQLKSVTAKFHELIQERIRLEGEAPDRSVEEIERDLAEAAERFDAELRNGMAIARIKQSMECLLEEMDSATYIGLEQEVSALLQKMTAGRYHEVVMQEVIPNGFRRKDGAVIPYDILSLGTKDILGIALRIAITKQFLAEVEGFIIMDDPLVDLDPDRQAKAAEAIKDFAEDKQLIILTCHPSHARLLGGNQIELQV
ncbi:MAG: AAA family ATPase [Thermodesulfobacteriota bacterium]